MCFRMDERLLLKFHRIPVDSIFGGPELARLGDSNLFIVPSALVLLGDVEGEEAEGLSLPTSFTSLMSEILDSAKSESWAHIRKI